MGDKDNNIKLFFVPQGSEELQEIKCINSVELKLSEEHFESVPLKEPITLTYDTSSLNHTFTFDVDADSVNLRKLFYTRIPRKKKKRAKKWLAGLRGKCIYDYIKHLRYDYMRMFYWIK